MNIDFSDDDFKSVFSSSLQDAYDDDLDLTDCYQEMYELITHYFPECNKGSELGGDEDTPIYLCPRPLKDGLGWTQINKETKALEKVLISTNVLGLDDVHYDSVVAHEAAHVATYNYILNQDETVQDDLLDEWHETKGHTKKWHEIVDKLNSIKRKSTGMPAFDIVEIMTDKSLKKYFQD